MGSIVDWIRFAEESPPIYLTDLDDEILRIRLYPPLHACILTTEAERTEREDFIAYLGTLTRQELLRLNYKKENMRI